ncbi:DUF6861 domain-containing protein [Pseudomonas putida]|uniref:DUF6861 domain-containing protein n=1 Tax=Pseudomonas TaxID=286 RepID=UPI003F4A9B6A
MVAGAFAFGVGAAPGAVAGAGIGLQVGNLILMGLGLSAIAEYFYQGLPALQQGMSTAWFAEDGIKPAGLDSSGGSAAQAQERVERAARQLARGQEQLVLLLLTAIVTYLTRGQMKAAVMSSMENIATRSARLQADISNRQLAAWLPGCRRMSRSYWRILNFRHVTPHHSGVQRLNHYLPTNALASYRRRLLSRQNPDTNLDSPKRIFLRSPKAKGPTPTTYPDPDYVAQHLAQFQNGASRFMTQTNLEKYGIAQKDGTSFIMLGHEATERLAKTAGDKRALEQALG